MAFSTDTVEAPTGTERIGAIACWGFGIAWAIWGLSGLSSASLAVAGVLSLALAAVTGVAAFRSRVNVVARRLRSDWQRRYNLLVLAEFVAIFLASFAFGRAGYPEAIPVAMCLIVGLHFFPLAGIFDMAAYRWTAIGLCLVAAVGCASLAVTGSTIVRAVVGLGAAAVLWATVAMLQTDASSH